MDKLKPRCSQFSDKEMIFMELELFHACDVRGREVERRPRNLEVANSSPGSGC